MISDLDEHVGTIVGRLEKLGLLRNTIIVFTSDNGPTHGGQDKAFHVGGAGVDFFKSTAGLRGFKGSCYEGGIRVPCIVRWPGKVASSSENSEPSYFADWFPTLAAIAGGELPKSQRLDGVDLSSALLGRKLPERVEPMIWDFGEYGGIVAIRDGDFKAIRRNVNEKKPEPWELYNLATDPGEQQDLAQQNPELVLKMEADYLARRTVEPDFPNLLYDK